MKMFRSIALGFGLLLATASYAQEAHVRAAVPFDFIVGNQSLPAGDYTVQSMQPTSSALVIRNNDDGKAIMALAGSSRQLKASDNTKLVFHRVGNRYFLSEIWEQGESAGRKLPVSPAETETALNQKVETVIIAASLIAR